MNTLAEQLLKAGVASQEQYDRAKAARALAQLNVITETRVNIQNLLFLKGSRSIREFKDGSKRLLLRDIYDIHDIIQIAHDLFKGQTGDKKLFYVLYQVRDNLRDFPKNDHTQIIKRAFRKSGATVEAPVSLKKKRK